VSSLNGACRALCSVARLIGISNGCFWGGISGGSGGNSVGDGNVSRGRSRRGSSDLRNEV
jgi:hypothetical protein